MALTHQVQSESRIMEDPTSHWHPARISDRELIELRDRLVKVQRLGGPFAQTQLSDAATERLAALDIK